MELAFKAFLRASGLPAPRGTEGHDLTKLCSKCRDNGLPVDRQLTNIVNLLHSENEHYGFRYFFFANTGRPEISFLRETVDNLLTTITAKVTEHDSKEKVKGKVLKMTVGKPVDRPNQSGG